MKRVRDLAAAVPALVDDQRVRRHLADELAHELGAAARCPCRARDVADAAAAEFARRTARLRSIQAR